MSNVIGQGRLPNDGAASIDGAPSIVFLSLRHVWSIPVTMAVTYRNNRLVPAVIIGTCLVLAFLLIDPSVENYGHVVPNSDNSAPHVETEAWTEAPAESSQPESANETTLNSHLAPADDDILLILKTGGTTLWKRLLIHLITSLAPSRISPSNIVIYSDQAETINGFTVIDALVNMTAETKESADFTVYREQAELNDFNYYVEASGVNGDDWGPVGGWIVDKYKFLPLMKHAGENWPRAKWYVYMEDDTYLFLDNVRRFLARFNPMEKHYLGSYAAKSNAVFAHGGAGFALSRGAWEASFGRSPSIVEDYQKYTEEHCCGDQVLGLALKDHGVTFGENGGDEAFTWGFNPLVHWSFAFSRSNWCHPLLSWHKVHSRDAARYFQLERDWDFSVIKPSFRHRNFADNDKQKPLTYGDFFSQMILPHVQQSVEWWDNTASMYEISSSNQQWAPKPDESSSFDAERWGKGWQSVEDCEEACRAWADCAMWTFVEDLCKLDDKMVMGQGYAPSMSQRKTSLKHTSGWLPDRLDQWTC